MVPENVVVLTKYEYVICFSSLVVYRALHMTSRRQKKDTDQILRIHSHN